MLVNRIIAKFFFRSELRRLLIISWNIGYSDIIISSPNSEDIEQEHKNYSTRDYSYISYVIKK